MAKTNHQNKNSNLWKDLEVFMNNSGISELRISKIDNRKEFRLSAYSDKIEMEIGGEGKNLEILNSDKIEMEIGGEGKNLEDAVIDAAHKTNHRVDTGLKFVNAVKL